MSNSQPVTIQGLTGSKAGSGGATVLTQAQANQLMQQLRSIQTSGASGTQAIKIHAIQTNPTTGAKQIVVIPSSAAASVTNGSQIQLNTSRVVTSLQSSPAKKVIKIQAASAVPSSNPSASFQHATPEMPPGVKVVKISTASGGQTRTVYSPQVRIFREIHVRNYKDTSKSTFHEIFYQKQNDFAHFFVKTQWHLIKL